MAPTFCPGPLCTPEEWDKVRKALAAAATPYGDPTTIDVPGAPQTWDRITEKTTLLALIGGDDAPEGAEYPFAQRLNSELRRAFPALDAVVMPGPFRPVDPSAVRGVATGRKATARGVCRLVVALLDDAGEPDD